MRRQIGRMREKGEKIKETNQTKKNLRNNSQ